VPSGCASSADWPRLAGFPVQYVKNLEISLESATKFLGAMSEAYAATKKNAAEGTAA
jgi:hypothetical protein